MDDMTCVSHYRCIYTQTNEELRCW